MNTYYLLYYFSTCTWTGGALHVMVALARAAGGAEFDRSVEKALAMLTAGDTTGFAAFEPAVRAVAGWTRNGELGDTQCTWITCESNVHCLVICTRSHSPTLYMHVPFYFTRTTSTVPYC